MWNLYALAGIYLVGRLIVLLLKRQHAVRLLFHAINVTPYGVYTELKEVILHHFRFLFFRNVDRSAVECEIEEHFRQILFQNKKKYSGAEASSSKVMITHSCRTIFFLVVESLLEESQKKRGQRKIRICTTSVIFGSFYHLLQSMQHKGDIIEFYEVDLCEVSWTLDKKSIKEEKVKECDLILCQHYFGVPFDQNHLFELGRRFDIPILEDCVQSGSLYGKYKGHTLADVTMWSGGLDKTPSCLGAGFGYFASTLHGHQLYERAYTLHCKFKEESLMSRFGNLASQTIHLMIAKNSLFMHYFAGLIVILMMKNEKIQIHDMALMVRKNKSISPFQQAFENFCRRPCIPHLLSIRYGLSKEKTYRSTAKEEQLKMHLLLGRIPSKYHAKLFPWLTPEVLRSHENNHGVSEFSWVASGPGKQTELAEFLSDRALIPMVNTTWDFFSGSSLKVGQQICSTLVHLPNLNQLRKHQVVYVAEVLSEWCQQETQVSMNSSGLGSKSFGRVGTLQPEHDEMKLNNLKQENDDIKFAPAPEDGKFGNELAPSKEPQQCIVWVSGYSLRAPKSDNPKEFYTNIRDGVDMTSPAARYPEGYLGLPPRAGILPTINRFDESFFHFNTKQVEKTDIAIRLLLEVTHEAIMDARISTSSLRGSKTGVYVGHCFSDYLNHVVNDESLTGYELVNGAHTMAANKISYFYDLKGPSIVIDTACSSSLTAFHIACTDIRNGVIDRAIVAGVSLTLDPKKNSTFNAFKMLSPDGRCFTFDKRANGYCRSEGIVAVILESNLKTNSGIAKVLGSSVNNDGFTPEGITFPSWEAQSANALQAFEDARVSPQTISYIEAHGTGTVAGDKAELLGLSHVFYGNSNDEQVSQDTGNARSISVGSVKSCMGHAEGASGLLGLVKCLIMYEKKQLLPNQNFVSTDHQPLLDGRFCVVTKTTSWKPGNVCISNYGFGGTNAFVILGKGLHDFDFESNQIKDDAESKVEFQFSNSPTTNFSRNSDRWFLEQVFLGNESGYRFRGGSEVKPSSKLCFLYGGQGSQWNGMGKILLSKSTIFRSTIKRLMAYIQEMDQSIDLISLFEDGSQWNRKKFSVLGIVAYEIATTNILREYGVQADFYIGHSLGEISAGYACGFHSEKESIQIAYTRTLLTCLVKRGYYLLKTTKDSMPDHGFELCLKPCNEANWFCYYVSHENLPFAQHFLSEGDELFDLTGQMASVNLDAPLIQSAIDTLELHETVIACHNSSKFQTVSGPERQMVDLKLYLEALHKDVSWQVVDTDNIAYHAPYLSSFSGFLHSKLSNILGTKARSSYLSKWISTSAPDNGSENIAPHLYHINNIVGPVLFTTALARLPLGTMILEVGPSGSLLGHVKRTRKDLCVGGFVRHGNPETELTYSNKMQTLGQLWKLGYTSAFSKDNGKSILLNKNKQQLRPTFESRWPDLWDHSKSHRIFTYKDFEYHRVTQGNDDSMVSVQYDVKGEHSFLMDHYIDGRALFPATGHIFTLWKAKGFDQGIRFKDLEILSAIVMDPTVEAKIFFQVSELDDRLSIIHKGSTVARCRFEVLAISSNICKLPIIGKDRNALSESEASIIQHQQFYSHAKRFGYNYQKCFQLVDKCEIFEKGQAPNPRATYATLRHSVHLIPFLDCMLQLGLLFEATSLRLPTLIREITLHPHVIDECKSTTMVWFNKDIRQIHSVAASVKGVLTTPANTSYTGELVHMKHIFVPLGEAKLGSDGKNEDIVQAATVYASSQLLEFIQRNPEILLKRPWLVDVQKHATVSGYLPAPAVDKQLYSSSLFYRIYVDLYSNILELLENTLYSISSHPEHEDFYETGTIVCSSSSELASYIGIVCKEWHGVNLNILECGAGSCGLTRRILPLVETQLEQYVCTDISSIRLGKLAGHPRISTDRHNLNNELSETKKYHLIVANNAVHTACSITNTLQYLCNGLEDGGMMLFEEFISDFPLYLWGLDRFVWETPSDSRSFGLWMSWEEWKQAIDSVHGLSLLACTLTKYRVTMLLHKDASRSTFTQDESSTEITVKKWESVSRNLEQEKRVLFFSPGADGFVKTLRQEEGVSVKLRAFVDIDLSYERSYINGSLNLSPLIFNHICDGKIGSMVPIPIKQPRLQVKDENINYALQIERPGDLSTLQWIQKPFNVDRSVRIKYSALNFKDVMYSFGKISLEVGTVGLEFSGIECTTERPVMGIGVKDCIAKYAEPSMRWDVPKGMSLEAAATIPVAYTTSLFSLFVKAGLKRGQSVLIHAGSGAVGHSAIYLCQSRGIEVFTTCSEGKREYMRKMFGIDDDHLGNSRDTSFREVVLARTAGQGVDAVLNSLSGDCLNASLECVKEYGHFCEIGAYDLQNNTLIGLKALERNVSYHAINLDTMFSDLNLSSLLWAILDDALSKGEIKPLPTTLFHANEIEKALRFMSGGKHIGKVLIDMDLSAPTCGICPRFYTSGYHVITGGLGGFGLELASWLLNHGACKVVLTSRTGVNTGWQQFRLCKIQEQHGKGSIVISKLNCIDAEQCKHLLLGPGGGPAYLKGIWHVAMVLEDSVFLNMTNEKWNKVHSVKVRGLKNLNELTRTSEFNLDCFVTFSSVASLFGSVGQSNYAHANAECETIINRRNAEGVQPPGLAIQWGMIDNVGYFARDKADFLETSLLPQNVDDSLDSLHILLSLQGTVTSYKWAKEAESFDVRKDISIENLQTKIAEILGGSPNEFDPDTPLDEFGVDSISRGEIMNWINTNVQKKVTVKYMLNPHLTIRGVFDYILEHKSQDNIPLTNTEEKSNENTPNGASIVEINDESGESNLPSDETHEENKTVSPNEDKTNIMNNTVVHCKPLTRSPSSSSQNILKNTIKEEEDNPKLSLCLRASQADCGENKFIAKLTDIPTPRHPSSGNIFVAKGNWTWNVNEKVKLYWIGQAFVVATCCYVAKFFALGDVPAFFVSNDFTAEATRYCVVFVLTRVFSRFLSWGTDHPVDSEQVNKVTSISPRHIVSSRETMELGILTTKTRYPAIDKNAPQLKSNDIPRENYCVSEFVEYRETRTKVEKTMQAGLRFPYFVEHEGVIGGTTMIEGRQFIDYTAYNYLGLAGDADVCAAAQHAIQTYGTSCSASRFSGERQIHRELETALADFLQCEDTLVFSAGYLAIASAIATLGKSETDLILYDRLSHRSAIDGVLSSPASSKPFPHNDYEFLDRFLSAHRNDYRRVIVAIEGSYSMDGDIPNVPEFVRLREKYKFILVIDEAHSLGCCGKTGRGLGEHFKISSQCVDVWAGTLSKCLASCGGYLAGRREMIEYFKVYAPGFVYSAGISPANTGAALGALRKMISEPERVSRLQGLAKLFYELCQTNGLDTLEATGECGVIPVIVGDFYKVMKVSSMLLEQGIHVQPITYPAVPAGTDRLRFFLSSLHTKEQIEFTVATCAKILIAVDQ